jgi:hypothetical protein
VRLSTDLLRTRRHSWWLAALLFVVLNGALLSMYRVVYAVRYDQLGGQAQARQEALEGLERERRDLEALLEQAEANRAGIETLYRERFATERERLTRIISEVKELARRAGLEPGTIAYPEEVIAEHDLVKKSIVFSVEGSYLSLRRFINFLELSNSFLVLEGISVTSAEPQLRISLTLSTLFADSRPGSTAPDGRRRGRA